MRLDINADGRYREEDNYLVYREGFSYEIFNIFELGILPIAWPYYYTRIYPKVPTSLAAKSNCSSFILRLK